MAKSAGRKTNPTQPRHAGVAVRSAAIAARASIRVKAAFSDALPSERGKPMPKAEDTALFKIAAKGCARLRGGVTASVRVMAGRWAQESDHGRHREPGEQPVSRNKRHEARAERRPPPEWRAKATPHVCAQSSSKAEGQRSTAERAARARLQWRPECWLLAGTPRRGKRIASSGMRRKPGLYCKQRRCKAKKSAAEREQGPVLGTETGSPSQRPPAGSRQTQGRSTMSFVTMMTKR